MVDVTPLYEACRGKLQVTLDYMKKDGTFVQHTGGIYELRGDRLWLWDTTTNDSIRQFIMGNITNFQILDLPFLPMNPEWGIKIDGMLVG